MLGPTGLARQKKRKKRDIKERKENRSFLKAFYYTILLYLCQDVCLLIFLLTFGFFCGIILRSAGKFNIGSLKVGSIIRLITSLVVASCVLVGSFTATTRIMQSMDYSQPRAATYLVTGGLGTGSGVLIAPGLMITAAHVVIGNPDLKVGGKPVEILKQDRDLDLALLKVELDCPCAPLASNSPLVDSPLIVVGFPLGGPEVVTEGRFQAVDVAPLVLVTAPVTFGNSGGGQFSFNWVSGQWELTGILVQTSGAQAGFIMVPVPHLSKSVSIETILMFIHHNAD